MKNQNTIFYIIGTVILVALIINSQVPKETGMIGLIPRYYKDGVEVFPTKGFLGFSMVTPPGESFDQILFDISGTNTGDIDITNMQIVDASPQVFKDAIMPLAHQTLNLGQTKKLWGEGDYIAMDTIQFESISPVNFWVKVSAYDSINNATVYEEAYSGGINFEAETEINPFLVSSSSFSLSDQWYSGYHMGGLKFDDVFFILKTGPSPGYEGYSYMGEYLGKWNPDGNFMFYGVDVANNYIWFCKADTSMPYTKHVKWYDFSSEEIGRFDLDAMNTEPRGIVVTEDNVYVGDSVLSMVFKYDFNGNLLETKFIEPLFRDFAYKDNQFFVTDSLLRVRVYDINWDDITSYDIDNSIAEPWGITYDGDAFWITDAEDDQRKAYSFSTQQIQDVEISALVVEGSCSSCDSGYDENWDTYTYSTISGHTIIHEDYLYPIEAGNIKIKIKSDDLGGLLYMSCLDSSETPILLGMSSFGIETHIFDVPSGCFLSGNIVTIRNDMFGEVNAVHYYESALLYT